MVMDANWCLKRAPVCICVSCVLILLSCWDSCPFASACAHMGGKARSNSCGGSSFVDRHSHTAFLGDSSEDHDDEEVPNIADRSCQMSETPPSPQPPPSALSTNEATLVGSSGKRAAGGRISQQGSPGTQVDARKKDCGKKKYKGSKNQRKKNKKKKKKMGKKKRRR
ncbi:hypothetical protein EGW08_010198 [Elysia chlorotica]|uniref:Uncharacterized protein n=1 Tax=Elysia chlorotica TaxID=188477 RepID=A0A433TKE5_ELYCH|nr:hypothetical protein EGW08_010198 [Elysia chlorotica]